MSLGPSSLHRAAADPLAGRRAAADCAHGSHAARCFTTKNATGKAIFVGLHHILHQLEMLGNFGRISTLGCLQEFENIDNLFTCMTGSGLVLVYCECW